MSSRRMGEDGDSSAPPAGYEIQLLREERIGGRRCYVATFFLHDKRHRALDGVVWIDAETHLPLRVEGTAAPLASAWMTDAFLARCQALIPCKPAKPGSPVTPGGRISPGAKRTRNT
ncbi:MAG: hypothetical protein ACRD1N_10385 [Terriglobia bacterium]